MTEKLPTEELKDELLRIQIEREKIQLENEILKLNKSKETDRVRTNFSVGLNGFFGFFINIFTGLYWLIKSYATLITAVTVFVLGALLLVDVAKDDYRNTYWDAQSKYSSSACATESSLRMMDDKWGWKEYGQCQEDKKMEFDRKNKKGHELSNIELVVWFLKKSSHAPAKPEGY